MLVKLIIYTFWRLRPSSFMSLVEKVSQIRGFPRNETSVRVSQKPIQSSQIKSSRSRQASMVTVAQPTYGIGKLHLHSLTHSISVPPNLIHVSSSAKTALLSYMWTTLLSWPVTIRHWKRSNKNYATMVTTSIETAISSRIWESNWTL